METPRMRKELEHRLRLAELKSVSFHAKALGLFNIPHLVSSLADIQRTTELPRSRGRIVFWDEPRSK